jgi:pimeloyl-ACP methyl ester carboxylesterase
VDELVPFLEAFTAEMPPPVVVAAHSQGAWLAWEAATADRLPGAEAVVLVGVFPENPVAYPARGERGPGGGGRFLLDVIEDLPRASGTTVFEADSPLGREWLGHPDAVEEVMGRSLPEGVRALAITSAFDLPMMHGSHRVEGATDACPVGVMHPNMPYARELQEAIAAFTRDEELPACPWWRTTIGPLFRHLSPPPT